MLFINFVCDYENCKNIQGAHFDSVNETYGDLLKALENIGWKLEKDNCVIKKCFCAEHANN